MNSPSSTCVFSCFHTLIKLTFLFGYMNPVFVLCLLVSANAKTIHTSFSLPYIRILVHIRKDALNRAVFIPPLRNSTLRRGDGERARAVQKGYSDDVPHDAKGLFLEGSSLLQAATFPDCLSFPITRSRIASPKNGFLDSLAKWRSRHVIFFPDMGCTH